MPTATRASVALAPIAISFCLSIGISKSYWGYYFSRPPVLNEIHNLAATPAIIPIQMKLTAQGRREFFIQPDYSITTEISRGKEDPYNHLDARLLIALEQTRRLPPKNSPDLSALPDPYPLIQSTGLLATSKPGYHSELYTGIIIDAISRTKQRIVFIGIRGSEVSNDHYPYYELLFTAPDKATPPTFVRGQRFS
jgi:hypothetical protein